MWKTILVSSVGHAHIISKIHANSNQLAKKSKKGLKALFYWAFLILPYNIYVQISTHNIVVHFICEMKYDRFF